MLTKSVLPRCFHGGAAYNWIGDSFEHIDLIDDVIDADVLDAWFEPSPRAVAALSERLSWSLRSSPPVVPTGVEREISRLVGIPTNSLVCGAGSSSLIFLALRDWLKPNSRVLLLDPTYGEYAHVLSNVIGCGYDSFELRPEENYKVDLQELIRNVRAVKYDMLILVNPNNPTGQLTRRDELERTIESIPKETIVWIDEAYIDYAGAEHSLGNFAATRRNVVVCKSLSKALALSGLRVAYLSGHSSIVERLKLITPPWSLSLLAQIVLIEALKDRQYYERCYATTHELRQTLSLALEQCSFLPRSSTANFILVEYPVNLPPLEDILSACADKRLLLRDVRSMGNTVPDNCFRVAVKNKMTNERMIKILKGIKTGS